MMIRLAATFTAIGSIASAVSSQCIEVLIQFEEEITCESATSVALAAFTFCDDDCENPEIRCPVELPSPQLVIDPQPSTCTSLAIADEPSPFTAIAYTTSREIFLTNCGPPPGGCPIVAGFSSSSAFVVVDTENQPCPSGTTTVTLPEPQFSVPAGERYIDAVFYGSCCAAAITTNAGTSFPDGFTQVVGGIPRWEADLQCGSLCDAFGQIGIRSFSFLESELDLDGDGFLTSRDADELDMRIAAGELACPLSLPCIPVELDLIEEGSTPANPVIDQEDVDALRRLATCVCHSLCEGDVNNDGAVDSADLLVVLANIGMGPGLSRAEGDLNCDGFVNSADLLIVLGAIGTTCL